MGETTASEELDYLRRYPDVSEAVSTGRFGTAREHFDRYGRYEGRSWNAAPPPEASVPLAGSCDVVLWSEDAFFIEGWVDDRLNPAIGLTIADIGTGARIGLPLQRVRRIDVEQHLGTPDPGELGFWAAGILPTGVRPDSAALALIYQNGAASPLRPANALRHGRREFFEHLLAYYGRRATLANLTARSFAELDLPLGSCMADLHDRLRGTRRISTTAAFGPAEPAPRISLVCVLYGIPDYLYLQVAQFARYGSTAGIEFLFVSNSPELEETLLRDAELASFVFGARIRVLSLNQNCGFSHANNLGIEAAATDAIVVINPDVFPRDGAAIARLFDHAERGAERLIAGGKLFYADGSVMHDGMFFEPERKLSALCASPVWTVEHFRKGFADRADGGERVVPAVSGALMVFDRVFARRVGLFDEAFIYGHYEDADLCLRASAAGGRVVLDPALSFWHYEGRGSLKRPEHAGSALYNRWLFSRRWGDRLAAEAAHA